MTDAARRHLGCAMANLLEASYHVGQAVSDPEYEIFMRRMAVLEKDLEQQLRAA